MKNILSKNKNNVYVLYTVLFTIICSIAFYSFIELGKSFIWSPDGFRQHFIILNDFNEMVRNILKNGVSMFSWNMGLGLDIIGQYSYYVLGDPFSYISLLFPMKYLKYVYELLVILRIYCVGISFIIYCKYNKKQNFGTLIGAIIYTFCGYIFYAAVRHPYFTNPVIMLPLVLLGIDKILKENKYSFFIGMIAIVAIMNYYFFYMVTIISVIYAIIKYIVEYRDRGIKDFFTIFLKTLLSYIIGTMIAGIILLPTIYAFLNSDRAGVGYTYYELSYYERMLFGQPNARYWSKTYISSIILLMLPVALFNIKKNKENLTILINILISFVILFIPFLGSLMNGFSFQSNRWVFAYVFFMAYLVCINLNKDIKYRGREIISMLVIVIIYCLMAIIATTINKKFVLVTLFTVAIMTLAVIIRNVYGRNIKKVEKICQYVITFTVVLNVITYAWGVYNKNLGNYVKQFVSFSKIEKQYNNYNNKLTDFDKMLKYTKQQDDGIYRIGTPIYQNNNISIIKNYMGLNMYLSIGNGYISDFTNELLILGTNTTNSLIELDSRTKITTLLGCKYYIVPKNKKQYVPYGYKLIQEQENANVYENNNSLGLGIFYDNYILQSDYQGLTPLEKEQALLETAAIKQTTDKPLKYNNNLKSDIQNDTTNSIDCNIKQKNKKYEVTFDNVLDSELYLYIDNLKYSSTDEYYVKVKYENVKKELRIRDKITCAYFIETPYILFNLGYKEKHSGKITIELTGKKGNYSYDNIQVIAVPMKKYEQSIERLKQTPFNIQELKDNYIKGTINNKTSGILQISTSYSTGWKAYVDGKETKVLNVNTGLIGIAIDEGEHEIIFRYQSPWLNLGILLSVLGLVLLIVVIKKERKRK